MVGGHRSHPALVLSIQISKPTEGANATRFTTMAREGMVLFEIHLVVGERAVVHGDFFTALDTARRAQPEIAPVDPGIRPAGMIDMTVGEDRVLEKKPFADFKRGIGSVFVRSEVAVELEDPGIL